jgi:hypothetical protein
MIGSKVVIGYDGKAVKQGFADINKHSKHLGKGLFSAFTGSSFGKAVAGITALGVAIKGITMFKEMVDFSGTLNDVSFQTGLAVDDVVVLGQAFKAAGIDASMAYMAISKLQKNLQDAKETEIVPLSLTDLKKGETDIYKYKETANEQYKALTKLGLSIRDLDTMKLDDAFWKIGKLISMKPRGEQEQLVSSLFGAKQGAKFLGVFNDIEAAKKRAERFRGIGLNFKKDQAELDDFGDALGDIPLLMNEMYRSLYGGMRRVFGKDFALNFLDKWFSEKSITGFVNRVSNAFDSISKMVNEKGFFGAIVDYLKDAFIDLGRYIGQGIAESIKGVMPWSFGGGKKTAGLSSNMFNPIASTSNGDGYGVEILKVLETSKDYLKKITNQGTPLFS